MNPTVKNLSVSYCKSMPATARSSFSEMAGKLPFEKKRTRELEIDRESYARKIIKNRSSNCSSYVAEYPEEIVGGVVYEKFETDNDQIALRVHGEWIQRNRTDIRQAIYQKISETFPGAYLLLIYPAQNRTARDEVSKYSFAQTVQTRTIYFYSRLLTRTFEDVSSVDSTVQLRKFHIPENNLSGFDPYSSVLDANVTFSNSQQPSEIIRATVREIPSRLERGNILQVRGLDKTVKIRAGRLLEGLKTGINEKNYSALEFTVGEENCSFRSILDNLNFTLRNKRIAWLGKLKAQV